MPEPFIREIAKETQGYTGAELEQIVKSSIKKAYVRKAKNVDSIFEITKKDLSPDEEESFYIVCDTFEESEEISPKRKFSDDAKEICFSMIAVPSKRMKNNGVKFPVYFYTPKKRIKEGEKIPSGNYFYHDNILWKKCYSKKMGYDEFFKFVETHF